MRGFLSSLGLLLALSQLSQQTAVQDQRDHYIAAVVDFSPNTIWNNGPQTLLKNAQLYIQHIEKAKQQDADIIVFPEDGLTSLQIGRNLSLWSSVIPSSDEEYIPCTQNRAGVSESVKQLSCAARNNSIYVVVNIAEKVLSVNGTHFHNTNAVFDRNGKIIARYRKVNLYGERHFETVQPPNVITFDTDFGVTFGTFICFDILFSVPPLNLTRMKGITDVVYSTAWFSEAPFLTAVETQYGWAYSEDVNLLASGYNRPQGGSTGSGIYLGRDGIADAIMSHSNGDTMLVARVPKKTSSRRLKVEDAKQNPPSDSEECYSTPNTVGLVEGIFLLRDNLVPFESLPLDQPSFDGTICHRSFCCEFHLNRTLDDLPSNNYRAVVYNGCRFYGTAAEAGIRVCGIIQCTNDSPNSCGIVKKSNTVFSNMKITATYPDFSKVLVMPSTLNSSVLPLEHWSYKEDASAKGARVTIALTKPTNNLVTLGLYTREFRSIKHSSVV